MTFRRDRAMDGAAPHRHFLVRIAAWNSATIEAIDARLPFPAAVQYRSSRRSSVVTFIETSELKNAGSGESGRLDKRPPHRGRTSRAQRKESRGAGMPNHRGTKIGFFSGPS